MFKLYLRNTKTHKMEVYHVETCTEAETLCLTAWPDCRCSPGGELIVSVQKLYDGKHGPNYVSQPLVIGRVEFQDKV